MINVNELKEYVEYISNKDQSGNTMSPDEFNMLLPRATEDILRWYIGLEAEYQPKSPFPSLGIDLSQKMKENVSHFKREVVLTVGARGGVSLPEDYYHKTSLSFTHRINCGGTFKEELRPIDVIDDDKWAGRLSNRIKKPTPKYPVANFNGKLTMKVAPLGLGKINMTYLRSIETPLWHYSIDTDTDTALYDPHGSKDIDMPKILLNDMARILLSYIGINLREAELFQYAEMIKGKGV